MKIELDLKSQKFDEAHLESSTSNAQDTCSADAPKSSGNSNPTATLTNPPADHMKTLAVETSIPTVSSPVPTACLNDSPEPSSDTRLISKRVTIQDDTPSLDNILSLTNRFQNILGVTTNTNDTNGVEADLGNTETTITASPTPTLRIYKDHPKSYIIGPSLVDRPKGVRPIGTKWVLKNKKDERGIVIRNKAMLVAQGHTQEEGINYDEVFTLVARIKAIRLFLAYASFIGFTVYQMDVKSAFLYGTIDEEVHQVTPKECHLQAVKRIFRYLKGHLKMGLWLSRPCEALSKEISSSILLFNSFSGRIVPLFDSMLVPQGEGSGTPTESHHTPTFEASQSSQHELPSLSLPPVPTESLPTVIPSDNPPPPLRQYTRRPRIAHSSVLPTVVDDPASPLGDDSQNKACPTDSGLEADQDRANKAKTSTLPSDSTPRVTSLTADEGSIQHKLDELTALCTSLQRQQSEMVSKFEAEELKINRLKARIKVLEDKDRGVVDQSKDDALIKRRRLDEGEEAAERVSDDTKEMATILTSIDAASILTSGGVQVVLTAAEVATTTVSIPTGSGVVPTASPTIPTAAPIFTTATESTPYTRRKGKETMVESDTPKKKKAQEQIDVQLARELEEEMARDAQRMNEQIAQDAKIARIHAEEELHMLIDGLDMNIKTVAKLVKESISIRPATSDKEMELLVELKRLYEPDNEDQLWTHTQNLMHALVEWKLYDTCRVHYVTSKDKEIFMFVEKDYLLKKGLAIVMICYKLQVENYAQMANDLILKI
nr:copia protein [Tanacetum cinerariifolium]